MANVAEPPLWQMLMLENFWPGLLVLGAVALTLGLSGLQRGSGRMLLAAAGFALLAGANVLVAQLVTTVREHAIHRTALLIDTAIQDPNRPLDLDALAGLLDPNIVLEVPAGNTYLDDRRTLLDLAQSTNDRYRIQDYQVVQLDAQQTGERTGQARLLLVTNIRFGGGGMLGGQAQNIPSTWLIEWRRTSAGWVAQRIVMTKVANRQPRPGDLPRPR